MQLSLFAGKAPTTDRKLRGGYYTPPPLARFLAGWAVRSAEDRVLEPACGDGVFVDAVAERVSALRVGSNKSQPGSFVGIELIAEELEKAQKRAGQPEVARNLKCEWQNTDFFEAFGDLQRGPLFDAVLGNPPFIRFQHFDPASRDRAFAWLRHYGWRPTKLANVWASFIQLSLPLIRTGGRLAMVVPAELLQVTYASELRSQLATWFDHLVLVAFRRLVFPEIQQEIVLLMAEGKRESPANQSDVHVLELANANALLLRDIVGERIAHSPAKHARRGMKWTSLFLPPSHFDALDAAQGAAGLSHLGDYASVDVGVVTGRNSYFVLSEELRSQLRTHAVIPIIGKTSALRSIKFLKRDFDSYEKRYPAYLLSLEGVPESRFSAGLRRYIEEGERAGIQRGYKCRIRKRWYDVPSVYTPDGFLFRQIHTYPLLVANTSGATSTDTVHRVRRINGVPMRQLAAAAVNSLTFAWAEVCGRSYGGGVLELEPREAEELPVPYFAEESIDVERVDSLLRKGDVFAALDYVDEELLVRRLGFDWTTVQLLRDAWQRLGDRRRGRREPARNSSDA